MITQDLFGILCGVEKLNLKGAKFEFTAFVIGKYKESGSRLTEIDVNLCDRKNMQGSIDVLEFVGTNLRVADLSNCKDITRNIHG